MDSLELLVSETGPNDDDAVFSRDTGNHWFRLLYFAYEDSLSSVTFNT